MEGGDWMANRTLGDRKLDEEGMLVLGVERRKGSYIGAPTSRTELRPGDTLILYGKEEAIGELDERKSGAGGNAEHRAGRQKHQREKDIEAIEDDQPGGES